VEVVGCVQSSKAVYKASERLMCGPGQFTPTQLVDYGSRNSAVVPM
jgi:hypothetical protein